MTYRCTHRFSYGKYGNHGTRVFREMVAAGRAKVVERWFGPGWDGFTYRLVFRSVEDYLWWLDEWDRRAGVRSPRAVESVRETVEDWESVPSMAAGRVTAGLQGLREGHVVHEGRSRHTRAG